MKKILIIVFTLCNMQSCSQSVNTSGEINRVCLDLKMIDEKDSITYEVRINNRKIIASKKVSGIQTGKKVIKIDKKLFNKLKYSLFMKSNIYSLPDSINCRKCEKGTMVTLSVRTKAGKKFISGKDPGEENADMKYIIEYISGMVGTIDDFELLNGKTF